MSFFEKVFDAIFGQKSKGGTILHEVIDRGSAYRSHYHQWIESKRPIWLISEIRNAIDLHQQSIIEEPRVHIMKSRYANGVAISYSDFFEKDDFRFLLDLFAEKVRELDYQVQSSDRRIIDRTAYTETIEKHYLKPKSGSGPLLNQGFGNILIEYVMVDDDPSYLKLSANIYSDRTYTEAKSFDALVGLLFN